ncbi:MAG: hypothetical protein HYS87_03665 [Candidatus Colwellbacteria bacterium]|nr:hypothetical protein [Candidatus Colwellbacteria bacterium]
MQWITAVLISLAAASAVSLGGWGITRMVMAENYDNEIGDHLERAGTANTVELALPELQIAIANIEARGLTHGDSTLIGKGSVQDDVGFWYANLKAVQGDLERLSADSTPHEKNLVLVKLKMTLQTVHPGGISIYPHNVGVAWWAWGSVAGVFGFLLLAIFADEWVKAHARRPYIIAD